MVKVKQEQMLILNLIRRINKFSWNIKYCKFQYCIQQMCVGCDCWKAEIVKRRRVEAEAKKQKQKLSYKIKQWLINKINKWRNKWQKK